MFSSSLVSAASLLPTLAAAINFDCSNILTEDQNYDLSPLGGVHEIYHAEKVDDAIVNTTYVLDLCNTLGKAATRGPLHCERSRNSTNHPK